MLGLFRLIVGAMAASMLCSASAMAAPVDVAIVFAVDSSSSVDPLTADLQREGRALAIKSPEVLAAIRRNEFGCIAVAYMEWSRPGSARTILPWTLICERSDAELASLIIRKAGDRGFARSGRRSTSISYALDFAGLLFEQMPHSAVRKVIDLSTNGVNNDGLPVERSRLKALSRGYTINAIVLPTSIDLSAAEMAAYLMEEVAGGPLGFVAAADGSSEYAAALRRKIVQEVSSIFVTETAL